MTATTTDWTEEQYSFLYGCADTIARSVHRSYPMVEVDDLLQEALMWCVQHPVVLSNYLEDEDQDVIARRVGGAMKNACREYAVKQRALARGDDTFIDDCWYSTEMLKGFGRAAGQRGLLHYVFDDEAWLSPPESGDSPGVRTKRDPAEGNNWLATLSDISAALDKLAISDPWAHSLLVLHYKQSYTYEEIGASLTPAASKVTVSRRIDRAVKKIQEILGGPQPRKDPEEPGWEEGLVGTRRAISNSHARALTENAYE